MRIKLKRPNQAWLPKEHRNVVSFTYFTITPETELFGIEDKLNRARSAVRIPKKKIMMTEFSKFISII